MFQFLGQAANDRRFQISDDMFWKDDRPFRIIGGDVHYFRVLPQVFLCTPCCCLKVITFSSK